MTIQNGHTKIFITIGKAETYTASGKPKLNTLRSTEAEFVAVIDAMHQKLMDKTFYSGPRNTCTKENHIPRQLKHHTIGRKWMDIQLEKNQSSKFEVVFCN